MDRGDWNDEAGSTVTFKLPMQGMEEQRNPFERYTKRRKGRAGTRFYMIVTTVESQPQTLYDDEVMLAGWNDSQSKGHTVKFWISNDIMGHPFEGISRKQELAIALAEMDDDNEPIDQRVRDRVEQAGIKPSQRVSYVAAMLCKSPMFHAWLGHDEWVKQQAREVPADWEDIATRWLYRHLQIDSRSELDSDETKAEKFHNTIRRPYLSWFEEHHDDKAAL
jgi:hypothetical protein